MASPTDPSPPLSETPPMESPTDPSPPPPSRVTRDTIHKAIDSLFTWRQETKSNPESPIEEDEDEFLYISLHLKKAPEKGRTNPSKIPLPHPLHASDSSQICLLIDDRPKSRLTKKDTEKKIEEDRVPVSKVVTLTELRSNWRAIDAKKKLCDSYDLFFADKKIVPSLPSLLGRVFDKKKKSAVPVDLTHKNWKEQIERVLGSATLLLKGAFIVLKAGRVAMAREEIVDNVMALIYGAAEVVPDGWENVRTFGVKMAGSLEMSVYQAEGIKFKKKSNKKNSEKGSVGQVVDDGDDKNKNLEIGDGGEAEEGKGRKGKKKKKALKKGQIREVIGDDKNDGLETGDGGNVEAGDVSSVGKKRKKDGKAKIMNENANGDDSEIVGAKKMKKGGKVKSTENGEAKKDELASSKTKKDSKSSGKKVKGKAKKTSLAAE